ncbi:hypothetical protein DMUE_4670 [Dictyocoela muelleri]|nr:hypothetical protein DMUE_4670 [Dictyocoela muelleri]
MVICYRGIENRSKRQRLYYMVKNSLKGTMIHRFNAFDGEEFNDLDSFIRFFKQEFQQEEDYYDIRACEFITKGPRDRNILEFTYELKIICKNTDISLKTIKNKFRDWVDCLLYEKIFEFESWKEIFILLKNDCNKISQKHMNKNSK